MAMVTLFLACMQLVRFLAACTATTGSAATQSLKTIIFGRQAGQQVTVYAREH